uniref:Leucine rich repeat containing 23 n=1 Tax=Nothoprocta perdicaria TaxID=30464 RepID=A0A8C6Z9N1_NOTPE
MEQEGEEEEDEEEKTMQEEEEEEEEEEQVREMGAGSGSDGGGWPLTSPPTGVSSVSVLLPCPLSQVLEPCPLTEENMKEGLSLLCKTGNGLMFCPPPLSHRHLTDISLLQRYIHLRYVNLSENKLRDLSPLSSLTHLLWLKVDGNLLTSACMQELPYLQIISFAHNRIKDMEGITHPRLANLSLKGNKIKAALGLSQGQLFSLHILELRGNKLESTAGLNLPKLKTLYLVRDAALTPV